MPRLALHLDPDLPEERLRSLTAEWRALLDRSHRPTETYETLLPGFAAVNLLLPFFKNRPQPAVTPDGQVYLWLDGELWDRDAAARAAGFQYASQASDPELCLALYRRLGDRFCEGLNGQFVLAVYEPGKRRLLVCNDRYGFRPLFWRADGLRFTCGTEIKSVLAAGEPARLDEVGALQLLAFGFELAERTLFEGVRALPPGSRLVFQDGRVQVERYWRFRYGQPSAASERDLAHELADRLRAAAERQMAGPGRVGMALSAGLDSRIVIAATPEDRRPCFAYTTGYPDSLDVLGARRLAQTYGVPHLHLVPEADYLSETAAPAVWRTEGCMLHPETTSLQFHPRTRPELDVILTGHAGGALSGQTLLPLPPNSRAHRDLPGYLFDRALQLPTEQLRALIRPDRWNGLWAEVRAAFDETTEGLEGQPPYDAAIEWNMERRQARFIHHAGQVDRDDFEIRAPLLDNDVVDFFLSVPYRYRFAQRLYKRTLAEAFPEAAAIPWSKTGGPVPGRPAPILAQFYGSGARRLLEKRFPALAPKKKDRVRTLGVISQEMRRDPRYRQEMLDGLLTGDLFPEDLLERPANREVVEAHWAGEDQPYVVAYLATLGLACRQFLAGAVRGEVPMPAEAAAAA
jgi:asparagine synthase (glutamine-hydrolysing)